jgi:hypothetical protein
MADTCLICLSSLVHKLEAYPQEFDLPSLFDHRSTDDMPSYGSDVSPGNYIAAPRRSDKLGTSIRNDGLRRTMQTHNARNIQLNILFSPVEGVHRNEMSGLGKSVDNYPNEVKLVAGEKQTHNKIHTDVFPFSGRNTQRLQQSRMPHMISLDPSTRVTFRNIASSLAFHTGPPELCLQIMIHLCAARVDGIFGSVSFIKYLLAQPMVL